MTDRLVRCVWPTRLAERINRVLALGLLLVISAFGIAFHQINVMPVAAQLADLITSHVAAVSAMPPSHAPEPATNRGIPVLEVRHAASPPKYAAPASRPFERALTIHLTERIGAGSTILFEDTSPTWLWVKPREDAGWVGLPIPTFKRQGTVLTGILLGSACLMVLVGGAVLSRLLTRPLRLLAESAPSMMAGSITTPYLTKSAPLEVRELASTLEQAAAEAREHIHRREVMLAGLSHDLRTPLARLRYALALSPSPEEDLQQQMEGDLDEMDGLVGLFLDLGENRKLSEPPVAIDIAGHVTSLLPKMSDRPWKFVAPGGLRANAPKLALRRLLGNLIRNAEIHGRPPFELHIGKDAGGIWISVIDHGDGIPEVDEARLVRPFERGAFTVEGSGLGLAIATQLTEAMGGQLEFERGPRFVVKLSGLFREH